MSGAVIAKGAPTLTHPRKKRENPPVFKIKHRVPAGKPAKHHFVRDGKGVIIDCPRCASISVSILPGDLPYGVSAPDGVSALTFDQGSESMPDPITPGPVNIALLRCRSCAHEWYAEVQHGD